MAADFTVEICKELGYYVYVLIDPRNGKAFYVGKGKDNRVFEHVRAFEHNKGDFKAYSDEESNELPPKLDVIREIKSAGLDPIHIIHRHGMSEEAAFEVEAALIDATPGLTNLQSGHGSNERGPAHVKQLVYQYSAKEIQFDPGHKLLIIKIRRETVKEKGVYEAVRRAWRINVKRAKQANYVLAVVDGVCRGVFVARKWQETEEQGRREFFGDAAEESVSMLYKDKRIPGSMKGPGKRAPFLYKNC